MSPVVGSVLIFALFIGKGLSQTCGGDILADISLEGSFHPPLSDGYYYDNNLDCVWTISAANGKTVFLKIVYINIEYHVRCKYDFLEIFEDQVHYGKFCGEKLPPYTFSRTDTLYVRFVSDMSVFYEGGFDAEYAKIESDKYDCGEILTGTEGSFRPADLDFDGYYDNDLDCLWMIKKLDNHVISLSFQNLSVEDTSRCNYDHLLIFQADSSIGRYCGSELPGNVNSTVDLFVRFYSDDEVVDIGFVADYSQIYIEGSEIFCSEFYNGTSGWFGLHEGNQPSPPNMWCTWVIMAGEGHVVQLNFLFVDLSPNDVYACNYEYLQIYDGLHTDPSVTSFGPYCNLNPPPNISSSVSMISLRYTAVPIVDEIYIAQIGSFNATFHQIEDPCGGNMTATTGTIRAIDRDRNGKYDLDLQCLWSIVAPDDSRVQLKFLSMDIEDSFYCLFDAVVIYDGSLDKIYGFYCGQELPPLVTTETNVMYVKFVTDGDDNQDFQGFTAIYSHVKVPGYACGGGDYSAATAWFHSLDSDNDGLYDNNLDCDWSVKVADGHLIQFKILTMDIEKEETCAYDSLKLYDDYWAIEKALIQTFCGSSLPSIVTTSYDILHVRFHSDGSFSGSGFSAVYSQVGELDVECGGYLNSIQGDISLRDVDQDGRYDNYVSCNWSVMAAKGHVILFKIFSMDIEPSANCQYDYLKTYDKVDGELLLTGTYCGSKPPPTIGTVSLVLHIAFHSDGSINGAGINASYSVVDVFSQATCGGILNNSRGLFSSVDSDSDGNYDDDLHCVWTIVAPEDHMILLNIMRMDIEEEVNCLMDYLKVYEGHRDIGRFCGTHYPPLIKTVTNKITVIFHSDYKVNGIGFIAEYSTTSDTDRHCGGALYGEGRFDFSFTNDTEGRVVSSLVNMGSYGNSLDCWWTVIVEDGAYALLKVLSMTIPDLKENENVETDRCRHGFIKIYDSLFDEDAIIQKYCGFSPPPTTVSRSQVLYLQLYSDGLIGEASLLGKYFPSDGFSDACGGILNSMSGQLMVLYTDSNTYESSLLCKWTIPGGPDEYIRFLITAMDIQKNELCEFDSIEVYDLIKPTGRFCGTVPPAIMTSTSSAMYIQLYLSDFIVDKGFTATYEVLSMTCGAVLLDAAGQFSYVHASQIGGERIECIWSIKANWDNIIELNVQRLAATDTTYCNYRYLEILDGRRHIGVFCGDNMPPVITATARRVTVAYRAIDSPELYTTEGFFATYQLFSGVHDRCGGVLTGSSGRIRSPDTNNDGLHDLSVDCLWQIRVRDGKSVHLIVKSLAIFCTSNNYLQILEDRKFITENCGTAVPPPVQSSSNEIFVIFHAGAVRRTVADYGFNALYYETDVVIEACGSILNSTSGNFSSLDSDLDGLYDRFIDCRWSIVATNGNVIELKITTLNIEQEETCKFDFLKVYDGENEEAQLVGTFCNNDRPLIIMSSSSFLFVRFYSDGSNQGLGFNAIYTQTDGVRHGYEEILSETNGMFDNLVVSGNYGYNIDRRWTIIVGNDKIVQLFIEYIDIESDDICRFDHIKIHDGSGASSAVIGEFCGQSAPGKIRSSSNSLHVHFYSDSSLTGTGFNATYSQAEILSWKMWPNGEYAIPRSVYGCPDNELNNWKYGYMRLIFPHRYHLDRQQYEEGVGIPQSQEYVLGLVGKNTFQMNFCAKIPEDAAGHIDSAEWPGGSYSIYQWATKCPEGFQEEPKTINFPFKVTALKYSAVPNITVSAHETNSTVTINVCKKMFIKDTHTLQSDVRFPIALLTYNTGNPKIIYGQHVTPIISSMQRLDIDYFLTFEIDEIFWLNYQIYLPYDTEQLFLEKQGTQPSDSLVFWALGMPIEQSDNKLTWLLYDLGQSVLISGVRFMADNVHSVNADITGQVIPSILLSETKWSFLYQGAIHCFSHVVYNAREIDIHCLNDPVAVSARYIILMDKYAESDLLQLVMSRSVSIWLFTNGASKRCNQALGMRNGAIEDFQLSASSENQYYPVHEGRPGGIGWCADPHDTKPYFEVDLLLSMKIEGFQVFTLQERFFETSDQNVSSSLVYGFTIEYSNTSFHSEGDMLDAFMLYEDGEVYTFITPIIARHVRIHSWLNNSRDGRICHKFELLGCLIIGTKSVQCSALSEMKWFATENVYGNQFYRLPKGKKTADSASDCILLCEEDTDYCSAVVLDTNRYTCEWYEESPSYSYARMTFDSDSTKTLTKICPAASLINKEQTASLYLVENRSWADITTAVESAGTIVSHGYPFQYTSGYLWSWDVALQNSENVNLMVYIAFNQYQVAGTSTGGKSRYTDMIDRLYIFTHLFDLNLIFTDSVVDDSRDAIVGVLDNSHNEKFSHYRTNFNKVRLVFRTFVQGLSGGARNSGFKTIIYPTTIPSCFSTEICTFGEANLVSASFLGQYSGFSEEKWKIEPLSPYFVSLYFDYFDVGCDTGSEVKIEYTPENTDNFCNMNKPFSRLTSTDKYLMLFFRYNKIANSLIEGFSASYKMLSKNQSVESLVSIEGTEYIDLANLNASKVCSYHFGKCYILLDDLVKTFGTFLTSWWFVQTSICKRFGWTLVSLHSKLEADFIGYNILKRSAHANNGYTYIGLQREISSKGYYEYIWSNESPVTFMTWAEGQPSPVLGQHCTRMLLRLSEDYKWESIPCDQQRASIGVCEYKISSDDYRNISRDNQPYKPSAHTSASLEYIERSSIFVCDNGEMISLLGKCNNISDCLDASDEINCPETAESCTANQFRCNDGKCVPISILCDHVKDCLDGSDEHCYFPACVVDEFRCSNHRCIAGSELCDGKQDCEDNSDEVDCISTICNNENSFLCGLTKCIPASFVCDGLIDCPGGRDEENCPSPNSCQEWWNAGYNQTGKYKLSDITVECDFDGVLTNNTITTRIHYIDHGRLLAGVAKLLFTYPKEQALNEVYADNRCYQSVEQQCQAWLQQMYHMETVIRKNEVHPCQCLRYIQKINTGSNSSKGTVEGCDDKNTSTLLKQAFHLEFETNPLLGHFETVRVKDDAPFNTEDMKMKVNPIECYTEIIPTTPGVPCGYGVSAPQETKCIYKYDEFQHIVGCRSLVHLQHCDNFECPKDYFKCPGSFCLEQRYVCDGIMQCEDGNDELSCDTRACESQYRCLQSSICLPLEYVCDDIPQCPHGDDERLCYFRCPLDCSCVGYAVDCARTTNISRNTTISVSATTRKIDVSSNPSAFLSLGLHQDNVQNLIHLNISSCQIHNISAEFLQFMQNLKVLDISFNSIMVIESNTFTSQKMMKTLVLHDNNELLTFQPEAFSGLKAMSEFTLSRLQIERVSRAAFYSLQLTTLDLTQNTISFLENNAFESLMVDHLYLNGSIIKSFSEELFTGLESVKIINSDAYKFCCIRPSYVPEENCYPYKDEFSSCDDLMRNEVLRSLIWIIGLFALLGNALSLVYRIIFDRARMKLGYGIFVSNLAISDFLMGVYLIIIAGADMSLRGEYIFNDESWRASGWCQFAGVISALSSEASVLFMCLITLDRILVIKYPFGQVRISQKPATIFALLVWIIGTIISVIPLVFTSYFKGEFYSKSGVCLALPLTRDRPAGWMYSISIFIGFNSVTFILIAIGQWMIYNEINSSKKMVGGKRSKRSNDLRVARNLLLVVTTDFLCWFPIGILGVLALTGHEIPGDVYVWTAVFVLPINSALNPFLYTLSAILGKKTFAPDTAEQSRKMTYTKEHIDEYLRLWKKRCFIKVNKRFEGYVTLTCMQQNECISRKTCLQIARGVIRCLFGLHARGLLQHNLAAEDVFIRKNMKGSVFVALNCHPRLVNKPIEKAANIESFGYLVSKLLQVCKLQD